MCSPEIDIIRILDFFSLRSVLTISDFNIKVEPIH